MDKFYRKNIKAREKNCASVPLVSVCEVPAYIMLLFSLVFSASEGLGSSLSA